MKRAILICVAIIMAVSMVGCSVGGIAPQATPAAQSTAPASTPAPQSTVTPQSTMPQETSIPQQSTVATAGTGSAILYANYSGTMDPSSDMVARYELVYEGELTVNVLADGLSTLTGLNFGINSYELGYDYVDVDWAADSTLIAGLGDEPQNENFFFYDAESLRWFMMDSLWMTITQNMGAEAVYYTMDGGVNLMFDELSPVSFFHPQAHYQGSEYYRNGGLPVTNGHSAMRLTSGVWSIEGAMDTAYIEMDGMGNFIAYYANGAEELRGTVAINEAYDHINYILFDMYSESGEFLDTITFLDYDVFGGKSYFAARFEKIMDYAF